MPTHYCPVSWFDNPDISKNEKILAIRYYINRVLVASDWTQLPNSGLTLSEQIAQQEIRLAWMELDDPELNPDTVELPPYPLMERP